ncbi:hypothetical protein HDU83_003114 [Entophlyctis luteolus]|nr:hypothetical protein HDU83_003114 [Entophlyctis luteolus]
MRRRAASYNVKRLPQRLRQRAIDQMAKDKLQPMKKSRRAKRRPGAIVEMFAKRSKENKRWLDTHLWHVKRMHMVHKWGFLLVGFSFLFSAINLPTKADYPNDQSTRATFRASQHAAITEIVAVVDSVADPTFMSVGGRRFLDGGRVGASFLHRAGAYPLGAIAPVTFFWVSEGSTMDVDKADAAAEGCLWIWCHPSAGSEVFELLNDASKDRGVAVTSLKSKLCRFELTGPRSHAILQEVLKPDFEYAKNKLAHEVWKTLGPLRTPASIPPGVILSLSILDPRISFPPKMKPRSLVAISQAQQNALHSTLINWPHNGSLAHTQLHCEEERKKFLRMSPAQKELNEEKSKESVTLGAEKVYEKRISEMHRVPVLLVQRGSPNTKSTGGAAEFVFGWDIILPSGTATEVIWKSLVFTGAHAVGLRDVRRVAFECGAAAMPYDYAECPAHSLLAREEAEFLFDEWSRRPKGKRTENPAAEKLPQGEKWRAFCADYAALARPRPAGELPNTEPVHVVHGHKSVAAVRNALYAGKTLQDIERACIDVVRAVRPRANVPAYPLHEAFVRCRLVMLHRGRPDDHGVVYRASPDDVAFWNAHLAARNAHDDADWSKPPPEHPQDAVAAVLDKTPPRDQMIGLVGFGGFSMMEGCGAAVGLCMVRGLVGLGKDDYVLVRGSMARICRPARLEIVE